MAALSASRNTPLRSIRKKLSIPLKANAQVYEGGLIAVDATGYGIDAAAATGYQLVLIASADATGTAADGGASVDAYVCEAFVDNYASDLVVQADLGKTVYVHDDHTVAHTSTGLSAAGTLTELTSAGCWVSFGGGI